MTTRREDIRAAILLALQDIDMTNTYDEAGVKYYLTNPVGVQDWVQGPEQVDNTNRPFIGFWQSGDEQPEPYPGMMLRITTPWRIHCFTSIRGDTHVNNTAQRTEANALMDDVSHAIHKDLRLGRAVCFVQVLNRDTTEGSLVEQGFVSLDIKTVHHQATED